MNANGTNEAHGRCYIDTHAHLDDAAFADDRNAVIERALDAGVTDMINIGYRPGVWASTISLAITFPAVRHTLGLHPQHAAECTPTLLSDLERQLVASGAVAIGEIGYDFYRGETNHEAQTVAFREQLALAATLRLPVVIHQRAAEQPTRAMLETVSRDQVVILHSFDAGWDLENLARDRGWFLGVGGLMTRKSATIIREIVAEFPMDRLLLETDSPYLPPTGLKSRRNEPASIPSIAEQLAQLRQLSVEEIARQTTENARSAFILDKRRVADTVTEANVSFGQRTATD